MWPIKHFWGSNHITGTAEPKVVNFWTQVGHINSSYRMTYHPQKVRVYGHVAVLKFCHLSWCSVLRGFVSDSWATWPICNTVDLCSCFLHVSLGSIHHVALIGWIIPNLIIFLTGTFLWWCPWWLCETSWMQVLTYRLQTFPYATVSKSFLSLHSLIATSGFIVQEPQGWTWFGRIKFFSLLFLVVWGMLIMNQAGDSWYLLGISWY